MARRNGSVEGGKGCRVAARIAKESAVVAIERSPGPASKKSRGSASDNGRVRSASLSVTDGTAAKRRKGAVE